MLIVGGQDQSGVVGKRLAGPIEVQVVDANGNGVSGQSVSFVVTSGGGNIFAGSAVTTADGIAKELWTLGTSTSDSQRVEARAVDPVSGAPLTLGTFRATPLADVPAQLTKTLGDGQFVSHGVAASDSISVRVSDQYGNPVPGVTVAWAVASGGGAVGPGTSITNTDGIARAQWTVGATSTQTATATVASLPAASFTAEFRPAAKLLLQTYAAGAEGGVVFATQPVVLIADEANHVIPDATNAVTLTVDPVGPGVVGAATVSAVNGVVTFGNVGLDAPAGTYALVYRATLNGALTNVTQAISVTPGSPVKYVVSSNMDMMEVGTTAAVTAQLADANGVAVPRAGRTVTWARSGASGSFASPTSSTNSAGLASVYFTLDTVFAQNTATLSGTDNQSVTGSKLVTVTTAPAAKLVFSAQPANTGWRITAAPVRVIVQDRYSNTVSTSSAPVTLSIANNPGGATLSGGQAMMAINGVATFNGLLLDQPGSGYALTATSETLTSATSDAFDVSGIGTIAAPSGLQTSMFKGLTVVRDSVYFVTHDPVNSLWGVIATGGEVSSKGGTAFFFWSGRVLSDNTLAVVSRVRILSGNLSTGSQGSLYLSRLGNDGPYQGPGRNINSFFRLPGPDLEFDGTDFYMVYRNSSNSQVGIASESGIMRAARNDNDSPLTLLSRQPAGYIPVIAVSDGQLYYADSTAAGITIKKMSVGGGPSTTIVTEVGNLMREVWRTMLVVGNTVYWSDAGDGAGIAAGIKSAPITGGAPTIRVPGVVASNLVSDGTYLYVNHAGSLRRHALSDFSVTTIVENDNVFDIALDGVAVYWTSNGSPRSIKKAPK